MIKHALKEFLPDRAVQTRIWRGPFRGARIWLNPRDSLRKIFGLYENELNRWLEETLRRVVRVIDVGANDGYFTFGCAAAFRRLGKGGEIIAFEAQPRYVALLRRTIAAQIRTAISVHLEIVQAFVGKELKQGMTTLDSVRWTLSDPAERTHTLIKIDVEGAELDVIEGGRSWLQPSNFFVIEVHKREFLSELKQIFAKSGHALIQINQRPLPFLGREDRDEKNWWLVSNLQQIRNTV
jgi:FkbM family methyltransferase